MQRGIIFTALIISGCPEPSGDSPNFTGASDAGEDDNNPTSGDSEGDDGSSADDDSPTSTADGSTDDGDTGGTGPKLDVGNDDTGGTASVAEVFGHSADTLYRMDPDTKAVEVVGGFTGCSSSIIDIALDAQSRMFGTAFGSLWEIDRKTGDCTFIANGSYPTSLSFVPAGTVDPDEEALVGFVDDEYIRIDTETGEVTSLGTLSDGLQSSGDVVSVIGGGTYLTVNGPDCDSGDCIIEFDPADGTVLVNYGVLPYDEVFGLAFWAGDAYGFSNAGDLFEIQFNGSSVVTIPIDIPSAPAGLQFYGAGSTTAAPPEG